MAKYYDPQGNPITVMEWSELFDSRGKTADNSWWQITTTVAGTKISTVWLGLDHGTDEDRPLIFESMVFRADGDEGEMRRYSSWDEAREGHAQLVKEYTPLVVKEG
jgi:hypothetical protein